MHGETDMVNIILFVYSDKIVFDDVTVGWCVECKSNKIITFRSIRTLDIFQRKYVIAMIGGFNSQYDEIYKLFTYYNRVVLPLYILFCIIIHLFGVVVIYCFWRI